MQAWLFGVNYVESSIKSGETTFITLRQAILIKWIVTVCYSIIMLISMVFKVYGVSQILDGTCP